MKITTQMRGRGAKGMAFKQRSGSHSQQRDRDGSVSQRRGGIQKKATFGNNGGKDSSTSGDAYLKDSNRMETSAVDIDNHNTTAEKSGGKGKKIKIYTSGDEVQSSRGSAVKKRRDPRRSENDRHKRRENEGSTIERIKINRVSTVIYQERHGQNGSNESDEISAFRGSRWSPSMQRGGKQRTDSDESLEDAGFRGSRGSARKERAASWNKGTDTIEGHDQEEHSSDTRLAKNKKDFLDKRRDAEYRRDYDESEDDEHPWDARARAVMQRQTQIRYKKQEDANNNLKNMEQKETEYIKDHDSYRDYIESDDNSSSSSPVRVVRNRPARNDQTGRKDKDNSSSSMIRSNPDVPDPRRDAQYNRDSNESDEDAWFWDRKGNAPRQQTGTQKRDIDSIKNVGNHGRNLVQAGTKFRTRRKFLKETIHAELKRSIENVQLVDFKRDYYESLNTPNRSIESNSQNNSSSFDSKTSLSSDAEDSIKHPGGTHRRNASIYRFPDHSNNERDFTAYPYRAGTVAPLHNRNSTWRPSTSSLDTARSEDSDHPWNAPHEERESSITSQSTSSSDTERSSGSRKSAATYLYSIRQRSAQ